MLKYKGKKKTVKVLFSFQKGDVFVVHNEMGSGWLWVSSQRTHESGLVFEELLEELVSLLS